MFNCDIPLAQPVMYTAILLFFLLLFYSQMCVERVQSCAVISLTIMPPLCLPFAINVLGLTQPCADALQFHFALLSSVIATFMVSYDRGYILPPLPNVAHDLQKPQSSLFALTCQISSFKGLGKKFTSRQTEMLRATVLPLSLHPSFLTIPHLFLILEMSLAE